MIGARSSRLLPAAVAVLAIGGARADAAIQYDAQAIASGGGMVSPSGDTVVVSWSSTPFAAYVDFTVANTFDLYLDMFVSNGSLSDVTGWIVDVLDGPGGTPTARLTNDTTFANSAVAPLTGNTNLFGLMGATNPLASTPDAMTPLLAGLAPGSYRLGVYDSATPSIATANFRIDESTPPPIASVPEAASGLVWLLGMTLAGGAMRR